MVAVVVVVVVVVVATLASLAAPALDVDCVVASAAATAPMTTTKHTAMRRRLLKREGASWSFDAMTASV